MTDIPIHDEVFNDYGPGTWGLDFFNPPNDFDTLPPGTDIEQLTRVWDALPLPQRHWYADWI